MEDVSRALVVMVTVLLVAELSGGVALVASGCQTACEGEGEEHGAPAEDCAPDCDECACCPHAQPAAPPLASVAIPPHVVKRIDNEPGVILDRGEPREILHVPRRAA